MWTIGDVVEEIAFGLVMLTLVAMLAATLALLVAITFG